MAFNVLPWEEDPWNKPEEDAEETGWELLFLFPGKTGRFILFIYFRKNANSRKRGGGVNGAPSFLHNNCWERGYKQTGNVSADRKRVKQFFFKYSLKIIIEYLLSLNYNLIGEFFRSYTAFLHKQSPLTINIQIIPALKTKLNH